jgi:hypothetical protein
VSSSSRASGSGSGVASRRLISADQASSASMGYTPLRAGASELAPSRAAHFRSPRWVSTRTVPGCFPLGRGALEGGRGRVIGCQGLGQPGHRQVLGGLAGGPPPPVHDLMAGDGKHPGPKRRLVALETAHAPDDPSQVSDARSSAAPGATTRK